MPTRIPTKAEFQTATNLKLVVSDKRSTDVYLLRIDELLDAYHATDLVPAKILLLGKIYYVANGWLAQAKRGGAGINTRRTEDVNAFFVKVVTRLTEDTTVPVNLLPNWLGETFGQAIDDRAVGMDLRTSSAQYLTAKEVAKYRLEFRGGQAFQHEWWTNSDSLVPADSVNVRRGTKELQTRQGRQDDVIAAGFSGYVMSAGGDFYTGPHCPGNQYKADGRYHSSYFAGESVMSAGEIRIDQGKVVKINNNSGHYKPGPERLMMAVEMLAALGVSMAELKVEAVTHGESTGTEFLAQWGTRYTNAITREGRLGNTPLSSYRASSAVHAHNQAIERQRAFALFKLHWKPKAQGGRAPYGKDKCEACRQFVNHFDAFQAAIAHYDGIDRVVIRDIRPAVVAR